jgi:hypothetical protein
MTDYLALGHVTLDRQPAGDLLPGGAVLFAALQAARFGLKAQLVSGGNPDDLNAPLHPYKSEISIELQPSSRTTVFENVGTGIQRQQTLHDWAGKLDMRSSLPPARIVHLAPVARELPLNAPLHFSEEVFVGLSPQGLLRQWDSRGRVSVHPLNLPPEVGRRIDVMVLSETEAAVGKSAIESVREAGGIVVVTFGGAGCVVLRGADDYRVPTPFRPVVVDDTGAGDVFAAAFLIRLQEGSDPFQAATFAHAAAALNLGELGVKGIATREEVRLHLEAVR